MNRKDLVELRTLAHRQRGIADSQIEVLNRLIHAYKEPPSTELIDASVRLIDAMEAVRKAQEDLAKSNRLRCGHIFVGFKDTPCIRPSLHTGRHMDRDGVRWD